MTDGGFLLEAKSSLSHEELFLLLFLIINNPCYGGGGCFAVLLCSPDAYIFFLVSLLMYFYQTLSHLLIVLIDGLKQGLKTCKLTLLHKDVEK